MTVAENSLWQILRSRQIDGHKFRRQVPFGPSTVDFVGHEARLIVEVDGGQHDAFLFKEVERTRFLQNQGYRVLRFWNHEILENPEGVHAVIAGYLHHATPTYPSPIKGEGP
jgi:very-short-patch-repair endonuclease